MANETVAFASQHVHTAVGMVGVIVGEAVAERPVPERPQAQRGHRVDLFTLDDDDVHDRQSRRSRADTQRIVRKPSAAVVGGRWLFGMERGCGTLRHVGDDTQPDQPLLDEALLDEAMKKSGVIWVTTPAEPRGRGFWYAWLERTAYVLTGPGEQPDPGWTDGAEVSVLARSKDTTERLVTFTAVANRLTPNAADWEAAATALAAGRLNLEASESAPSRWASGTAILYRLSPTGSLVERPGHYSSESHRAAPLPTPATTQGKKPFVLHKRGGSGRPLS